MTTNIILWKRPTEKKYKTLGVGFKDGGMASHEAADMLRRGLDVKIKANRKIWFDSRLMFRKSLERLKGTL
jgi:hypothetical protein